MCSGAFLINHLFFLLLSTDDPAVDAREDRKYYDHCGNRPESENSISKFRSGHHSNAREI